MATRAYAIISDSKPPVLIDEFSSQAKAFEAAIEIEKNRPIFIQQYVNGRMGQSWTTDQLRDKLYNNKPISI